MFSPNTRVLVVDDMSVMRLLVASLLKGLGFTHVVEATDGSDAWKKFTQAEQNGAPFQLVISDWNMPRLKGIDLVRRIRQSPTLGATPFVMLTAENDQASLAESTAAGVTAHLAKPFNEALFREKIAEAFEKTKQGAA